MNIGRKFGFVSINLKKKIEFKKKNYFQNCLRAELTIIRKSNIRYYYSDEETMDFG